MNRTSAFLSANYSFLERGSWDKGKSSDSISLSDGDLIAELTKSLDIWSVLKTTAIPYGGKYYFEFKIDRGLEPDLIFGIGPKTSEPVKDWGDWKNGAKMNAGAILNPDDWPQSGFALIRDTVNDLNLMKWDSCYFGALENLQGLSSHSVNATYYPYPNIPVGFTHWSYLGLGHIILEKASNFRLLPYLESNHPLSVTEPAGAPSFKKGDVISIAIDTIRGWAWVAKNGAWIKSGNPSLLSNATVTELPQADLSLFFYLKRKGDRVILNFGDSEFKYQAPAGFVGVNKNVSNFHINGKVERLNIPVERSVLLIDRESKILLNNVNSTPGTGNYSFLNVRGDRKYLLVALPLLNEKNLNALCIDHVTPSVN